MRAVCQTSKIVCIFSSPNALGPGSGKGLTTRWHHWSHDIAVSSTFLLCKLTNSSINEQVHSSSLLTLKSPPCC